MVGDNPFQPPTPETVRSVESFLWFVWERECIRIAKENGHPAPWTDDPVLQKYSFTNIHRKDDRVTKWIIENIIEPNVEDTELWFTLLITRLVNWPPTLSELIKEKVIPCVPFLQEGGNPNLFSPEKFISVLTRLKSSGVKVYSGAYMVYPTMKDPGGDKSTSLCKYIISDVIKNSKEISMTLWTPNEEPTIEKFVNALSSCFGISTFIAGQVAADLTYHYGPLENAPDLYTYAPIGPGSQKGLNYVYNFKLTHAWDQEEFNKALIYTRNLIVEKLDITDLTLHDVQNCMCEISKYARTVLGEGKPKTYYVPETNF